MAKLAEGTVFPPTPVATADLLGLAEVLVEQQRVALVGADGVQHTVPDEVRQVLAQAVHAMVDGQAVTIASRGTVLTTQEAAEVLGVSRPTLVKLLEKGDIPFIKPGRHRRVQLEDLLGYQRRLREQRRSELAAMANEAAEDDAYRAVDRFVQTR